jgi:hypothetical protein
MTGENHPLDFLKTRFFMRLLRRDVSLRMTRPH